VEISALFWAKTWGVDDLGALHVEGLVVGGLHKPTDRLDVAGFPLVLLWRGRQPQQEQIQVQLEWKGDALPAPVSRVMDLSYAGADESGFFVINVGQEYATPEPGRLRLDARIVGEPGPSAWIEYDVVPGVAT
jgi:hypothetical protein